MASKNGNASKNGTAPVQGGALAVELFDDRNPVHVVVQDLDVREPVAVEVSTFRGRQNLGIRHWYERAKDGLFARTQKGVNVPIEDHEQVLRAIAEAVNQHYGYQRVTVTINEQ